MSAREFAEWMVIARLDPFGDDWIQAGTIAAAAANSNPYRQRVVQPAQFIPRPRRRQSGRQIEATVEHFFNRLGKSS